MKKTLDLGKSVYELTKEYPELVQIMDGLGFHEITKKAMLHSVGKIMTIPKGAGMKNISMESVIGALEQKGFQVLADGSFQSDIPGKGKPGAAAKQENGRTEKLKSYLKRLSAGEELDRVKADFVSEFQDVDAAEIMRAEQELMEEGTPLDEVQKLCDVHSALFHGATREERIAGAEKAVEASLQKEATGKDAHTEKMERAAELLKTNGHPVQTLTKENETFEKLLKQVEKENYSAGTDIEKLREIAVHYAKKGDLLYPHLKVKYGISGPSDVMWTVDDEIRDELSSLAKEKERDEKWTERLKEVLTRADEMIYKEANILFPICAVNFTEEEWVQIYQDSKDYAVCLGVQGERWEKAENSVSVKRAEKEDEIIMPGGHLTLAQLTALLNTIPMEISFVDADNINRFFNEGPKVFKRPGMAIDREVFSCHPPKIEPMVRGIIDDFRNNRRDHVPVWMEKNGRMMLVNYMAVRDKNDSYLGTVELVQDMEFAKEYFKG